MELSVHFRKAHKEHSRHFRKANTEPSMNFRKANTGILISFWFTPSFTPSLLLVLLTTNQTSKFIPVFTPSFNHKITTSLLHHNQCNLPTKYQ